MNLRLETISIPDLSEIHRLNESECPHVSSITRSELEYLFESSIYARKVMDEKVIAGFLLGFDEHAHYESLNYQWFKSRYPSFFYIDRIVVAATHRRRGVGRMLYSDVNVFAKARGFTHVTCEVNIRPPNLDSSAYHLKMGYESVGEQDTEGGKKRVNLLAKRL